jgi:hypothetical protein
MNFSIDVLFKSIQYQILGKFFKLELSRHLRTDVRTDRHDKGNRCSLPLTQLRVKN